MRVRTKYWVNGKGSAGANLQEDEEGQAGVRNENSGNQKHQQGVEYVFGDGRDGDNQTASVVWEGKHDSKLE